MLRLKHARIKSILSIACLSAVLAACSSDDTAVASMPAPVVNGIANQARNSALTSYRVQKGDTLYSIAWRFALDYNDLAKINHLPSPYVLHVGQTVYLKPTHRQAPATAKPKSMAKPATPPVRTTQAKPTTRPTTLSFSGHWQWPARGPVIQGYAPTGNANSKGIDIAGRKGQPVVAAAAGKVVYRGNGLRGYGQLVILKHNATYLSAYAHNSRILVKEGQWVKAGQKIAEMGSSDARRVQLHFEIRKKGKPVNPLQYLPKA